MSGRPSRLAARGFAALAVVLAGGLGSAVLALPDQSRGLAPQVEAALDRSGVTNPVTAVLLNFRAYDTMLELTVLLLAVLGARALATGGAEDEVERFRRTATPVLRGFVRVMAPVAIIVVGYLLWVGAHAPGGAFQAAAVLAALGIVLLQAGIAWHGHLSRSMEKCLLVGGVAIFILVGVGTMSAERHLLEYPPKFAKWLILLIESIATLSIAAILVALYRSGSLVHASRGREAQKASSK